MMSGFLVHSRPLLYDANINIVSRVSRFEYLALVELRESTSLLVVCFCTSAVSYLYVSDYMSVYTTVTTNHQIEFFFHKPPILSTTRLTDCTYSVQRDRLSRLEVSFRGSIFDLIAQFTGQKVH